MRRVHLFLLPILFVGAASCDLLDSEEFTLPGTYLLTSIDGVSLPAPLVEEPSLRIQVWGLTLQLEADGTYRSRLELRISRNDTTVLASVRSEGDFQREGQSILLDEATVEGDRSELEILDGRTLREITALHHVLHYERVTPRR